MDNSPDLQAASAYVTNLRSCSASRVHYSQLLPDAPPRPPQEYVLGIHFQSSSRLPTLDISLAALSGCLVCAVYASFWMSACLSEV